MAQMSAAQAAQQRNRDVKGKYRTTEVPETYLEDLDEIPQVEDLIDVESALDRLYDILDQIDAGECTFGETKIERAELLSTVATSAEGRRRVEWAPDELFAGIHGSGTETGRRQVLEVGTRREKRLSEVIESGACRELVSVGQDRFGDVYAVGTKIATSHLGLGRDEGRAPRTVERVSRRSYVLSGTGSARSPMNHIRWAGGRLFTDSQGNLIEYDPYGSIVKVHRRAS